MKIEVLGAGCAKCRALEEQAKQAIAALGVQAEVEHVTDFRRIAGYGILSTPALVIDGQVKCAGRIPSDKELKSWIGAATEVSAA